MKYYIGTDIGGTNIVCGLIDSEGRLVRKLKTTTDVAQGSDHVFDKIAGLVRQLIQEQGLDMSALAGMGIGTPGFVDPLQGMTIFASNLKWNNVRVADEMNRRLGVPVFVDNDVRMYVYGEAMAGTGKGYDNVFGLTLGTGMASALVNHGKLYYGGGFMAGELGHIPFDQIPYKCGCGLTGCLETIASATGIARQARDLIAQGRTSVMSEWFPGEQLEQLKASDVSKAFDLGDQVAIDVMENTGKLLGRGLAYAVTMLSPDIIVIGGGAALAGERLFAPMRRELQKSVIKIYWDRLTIAPAEHNDDAGIIGSAVFARERLAELA